MPIGAEDKVPCASILFSLASQTGQTERIKTIHMILPNYKYSKMTMVIMNTVKNDFGNNDYMTILTTVNLSLPLIMTTSYSV